MNSQIIERTNKKIAQNYQASQHTTTINGRTYTVHKNVFSPSIFLGSEWLTNNLISCLKGESFMQIGVGCGCTLVQVLLSGKIKRAAGGDITKQAVTNTIENLERYKLKAEVYVSDVFEAIPKGERFDTIYWNFPFHPTEEDNKSLGPIEKGVKNHNYESLNVFLSGIRERLTQNGTIYLGFSQIMGDTKALDNIAQSHNFSWSIKAQNKTKLICLIHLEPN